MHCVAGPGWVGLSFGGRRDKGWGHHGHVRIRWACVPCSTEHRLLDTRPTYTTQSQGRVEVPRWPGMQGTWHPLPAPCPRLTARICGAACYPHNQRAHPPVAGPAAGQAGAAGAAARVMPVKAQQHGLGTPGAGSQGNGCAVMGLSPSVPCWLIGIRQVRSGQVRSEGSIGQGSKQRAGHRPAVGTRGLPLGWKGQHIRTPLWSAG